MYLSFETAKKLNELGVTFPESHLVWRVYKQNALNFEVLRKEDIQWQTHFEGVIIVDAPSFNELWQVLPSTVWLENGFQGHLRMYRTEKGEASIIYTSIASYFGSAYIISTDPSPTEAAGKLVGLLKEKNIL